MPVVPGMKGKTVAVMGLGRSGQSAAHALAASGAEVWAWDDAPAARAEAAARGIAVVDLAAADLTRAALVVWSPGISHTYPRPHPVAAAARAANRPLVCDIELLALAAPRARYVGVTGTNGKSTTTTLIAHLLAAGGYRVAVGGNLGTPALDLAELGAEGIYVLELSSYQLELLDRARFDAGVLLNITPDHLGRHGGMDGYAAAKASLFRRLRAEGVAVIGVDDRHCCAILDGLPTVARRLAVPFSAQRRVAGGVYAPRGVLTDDGDGQAREIVDLATVPTLPGRHNWQNACAAFATCRALGMEAGAIRDGLIRYPGLAHRQELIAVVDGVTYVNDSKATNADAAEKALVCYRDLYWILGGQPKEGGIASLVPEFPRVRRAFLIGEAAPAFAATLEGKVPYEQCGTLEVAVAAARKAALDEGAAHPVVLLSPACASWDQFKNFEARGDLFRGLVNALSGERMVP